MLQRIFICIALCCITVISSAQNNTYIKIVVPFAPGDALDATARSLATSIEAETKRTVIVENRPGASGFIAAQAVAASNDGRTFLLGTTAMMSVTPFVMKAPYAPNDFDPIAKVANIGGVFAISNNIPANSWESFVKLAKNSPEKYTYASSGPGTILHLVMEQLQQMAGIKLLHVPYKGMGPAKVDFLAGQVDVYIEPSIIPLVKQNKAKAFAVLGDTRLEELPEVPTMRELKVDCCLKPWIGLFSPKGASPELSKEIEKAIQKAVTSSQVKERLTPGTSAAFLDAVSFRREIQAEQVKFKKLIEELKLKVE